MAQELVFKSQIRLKARKAKIRALRPKSTGSCIKSEIRFNKTVFILSLFHFDLKHSNNVLPFLLIYYTNKIKYQL